MLWIPVSLVGMGTKFLSSLIAFVQYDHLYLSNFIKKWMLIGEALFCK